MASINVCFAVGLFIIALSTTGFSEDVPDDVVYTEIKKTLVNGTKGILTCQFKGTPNAVYWIKGSDSDVTLSFMKWAYGSKSGPRYEDGSCDMDENYSLIINNVEYADAGHYMCEVSSYKGFLIYNYTDVTITSRGVKTQQSVTFQMGAVGILPCQVNIRPKMVSWLKGINTTLVTIDLSRDVIEISEPGYEEGLFNMSKEYSLVVNDVTIQHEGYFFCEVTDFDTDKLYRDYTLLTVFAQPTKPFPVIQECPMADQTNCIIPTDSPVMLTCNVNQYYPDINLIFTHGSEQAESLINITLNNTDGTKNKSVAISAVVSRDVYKCIASGIPGFDLNDERSSSVRLIQHVQEQSNSPILAVLIVPIVICLTVVLLAWMRLRNRGTQISTETVTVHTDIKDKKLDSPANNDEEASEEKYIKYRKDHILFLELWTLVKFIIDKKETPKLVSLITLLHGDEELQKKMDQKYYYHKLCRWKDSCDEGINQRTTLYNGCRQCGIDTSEQTIEEFLQNISTEILPHDFEHILWHISESCKMKEFLVSLGMDMGRETELAPKKKIVEEAKRKLKTWNRSELGCFNPLIIICSTMEMLGYCTADNNFFQIPIEEKDKLSDDELHRYARDVTCNHWQKLGKIKSSTGERKPTDPNKNNKVLFNTEKMLRDWWEDVECSNYEKRRKLGGLSDVLSDNNESPGSNYVSNEELTLIARYLDSTSMAHLCDKLHITRTSEDAGENERFEVLCQWRTSVKETEWTSLYDQLRTNLHEAGFLGLLQPLRNDPIHKAEYVDIAFDLLMTDVLPLAKALGVNVNKFAAYRPVFKPAHLKEGTPGLVAHLVESTTAGNSRLFLCTCLREAGFPLAVTKNLLVNHMAYGELYNISYAMREDTCGQGVNGTDDDQEKAPDESDSLLKKDGISSTVMKSFSKEEEAMCFLPPHLSEIKRMLELTDEELPTCTHPSECPDEFTLFRIWKQRPHPAGFNERAAIMQGMFDIERSDTARLVAEGKFYVREITLPFIMYVVKKMSEHERQRFTTAFNLQTAGGHGSVNNLATIIHTFLKNWKNTSTLPIFGKANDYEPLIDKLVEHGFLDIARELSVVH